MSPSAPDNPLASIVGLRLTAVVFVEDYVQLQFESPATVLTAITLPRVTVSGERWYEGTPGYRDALCGLITTSVRAASVIEGSEIRIELENQAILTVSLNPEEARGEEAATFSTGPGNLWVW
jgi:hypothetical protein